MKTAETQLDAAHIVQAQLQIIAALAPTDTAVRIAADLGLRLMTEVINDCETAVDQQ